MNQNAVPSKEPLWLSIEMKIHALGDADLAADRLESTIQRLAGEFDATGLNFSRNAGHMLMLRGALSAREAVGHSFLGDFEAAVGELTLDEVADIQKATRMLIGTVGQTWPILMLSERQPDVKAIVEATRLDLLVTRAKELGGDAGIRHLIEAELKREVIIRSLDITADDHTRVNAEVEAERAERARVSGLLGEVSGKPDADRIRHLINKDVAEVLILEMAGVDQGAVDGVKKAMVAELAEKRRKAEEEAARQKAEAEGPPLEDIPDDDMLDYIESIREILEFSDVPDEIRTMCNQSSIPKCLVEIAVSEPGKLDELESKAGS